jgi:hypothetical protein
MPYAFLAGLSLGWLRLSTGSTVNTLFVHTLNNLLFLRLGLLLREIDRSQANFGPLSEILLQQIMAPYNQ